MAAKGCSYEAVRGIDPRGDDGMPSQWLKLDAGDTLDVACLVNVEDIIAVEQCAIWLDEGNSPVWVYTGPDDPSHELGVDPYLSCLPSCSARR